jgi:triosephosphate isomerase
MPLDGNRYGTHTKFVAGNWKMNTTKASAVELAKASPRARRRRRRSASRRRLFISTRSAGDRRVELLLGAQDVYFEKTARSPARFPWRCSRTWA